MRQGNPPWATRTPSAEQSRREIVEITAPCLPLVRRSIRLEVHEPHTRCLEGQGGPAVTGAKQLRLRRPHTEPQQFHSAVECGRIREGPFVRGLGVKGTLFRS